MIFRQITHDDLGCASYLVGDEHAGVAAVVDPRLDVEEYLSLARYAGGRIEHVHETHNHADHVSGHGRLAAATGATIHVHRDADASYPHEPFDDGWELRLGSVLVRALHTPGHRPEHCSFVLIDCERGDQPWAVLTGDTLFVGDVARPDLAVERVEGARGMFRSLRALLELPDACEVWPAHLGGSLCGGPGMDLKVASTIGYERANSPLLRIADEAEFVRVATAALRPQPPNFHAIVAANRGPLSAEIAAVPALTPRELAAAQTGGALVVDLRPDLEFDEAHIPGAIANPSVHAGFGTKLGWIAHGGRDVVLVGRDEADALRAARLAAAVGIRSVAGWLAGGMSAWREDGRPVASIERIGLEELHSRDGALQLLDVREEDERRTVRIPGSAWRAYHDLDEVPEELDPARPIAAICASGQRAAVAASLLAHHGAAHPIHVVGGGVGTWERHGWPVERNGA
jgi:glyoxylase-like metal-dependent hydrolase (beta-lactamase superfamily II)/rhodanese-related sulfurtransferase